MPSSATGIQPRRSRDKRRGKYSLARRLILSCLALYLVAAAAFEAIEILSASSAAKRKLEARITFLAEANLPALSSAVWKMDDEIAGLILDGISNDPAVARVELLDAGGRPLVRPAPDRAQGPLGEPRSFPLSFAPPFGPAQGLGSLIVYPSLASARDGLRQSLITGLERTAIITLLLFAILFFAIQRYLGRPLRRLAAGIASIDPASPLSFSLGGSGRLGSELELVGAALDSMAEKVEASLEALRESERRLWSTFEDSPISIWDEDFSALKERIDKARGEGVTDWEAYFGPDERVLEYNALVRVRDVNRSTLISLGIDDKARLMGGGLPVPLTGPQIQSMRREFVALASGATTYEGETEFIRPESSKIYFQIKVSIVPGSEDSWDRVLASVIDITERKVAELVLKESLREKELLLREVHHRVKNNLQIVCSLVSLERGDADPKSPVAVSLAAIESRVWSMSLVHETLYENDNLALLDFPSYAGRLCGHLLAAFLDEPGRVRLDLEIEEGLALALEKAIPLGLIINELVANALKHGFGGGRRGRIRLEMRRIPGDKISLLVADDGIGSSSRPASGEGAKTGRSIGLDLVAGLAAQLGGSHSIEIGEGFRVQVVFPA